MAARREELGGFAVACAFPRFLLFTMESSWLIALGPPLGLAAIKGGRVLDVVTQRRASPFVAMR